MVNPEQGDIEQGRNTSSLLAASGCIDGNEAGRFRSKSLVVGKEQKKVAHKQTPRKSLRQHVVRNIV
jgi:hypothetical protein